MGRLFQYNGLRVILLFTALLWSSGLHAQLSPALYDYPQNHLPWYTIESDHFLIHFQEGNSRSAQIASRTAEEVYPHITGLYKLEPDTKTSIILTDRQDYSNGAAYFFDNQIRIWIPALNTPLRGTHNWMRDVITHEFIHIVQLQASMKKSRRLPALYFQWLSYEDVRRPDVLYGYPKGIITHPFASISIPAWFAEGAAQFQRLGWYYDTWDSHRDMILRSAILNDTYLTLEEMGIFTSKNGLEREQAYNQGFAFTLYLVLRFGEEILPKLSEAFAHTGVFSAQKALHQATGIPGDVLFEDWVEDRTTFYREATEHIAPTESKIWETEGYFNFFPQFSPSGDNLAYLSNKGKDESITSLYIQGTGQNEKTTLKLDLGRFRDSTPSPYSCNLSAKPLIDRTHSRFSFSPDGQKIVFSRSKLNAYGETYDDLFIYNLNTGKEQRLTRSKRISSPAWHPRDKKVAAVLQYRGTQNLVLLDLSTRTLTPLTDYKHGEQVFTPVWHPDGNAIYFAYSEKYGRNIKRFDIATQQTSDVLANAYIDYRDPFIDPNGLHLYYASDEDGIFNIYRKPIDGSVTEKLTNVIGGAFMPSINRQNELVFSEYGKTGYRIASLPPSKNYDQQTARGYDPVLPNLKTSAIAAEYRQLNNFDDTDLEPFSSKLYSEADSSSVSVSIATVGEENSRQFYKYRETFTSLSFYPVVRFDTYSKLNGSNGSLIKSGKWGEFGENMLRDLKLGTYFSSREVIDKLNLFGGALIGFGSQNADGIPDFFSPSRLSDLDRDLFLITEYQGLPFIKKRWSPTISLELYNLRRNVDNGLSIEEFPCTSCLPDTLQADIAYNIWEADLFLRSKINESNLVELGVGYTPYRVQTEGFFSRELEQFIPSSSSEYFKGAFFSATHVFEAFKPYRHGDVAPIGLRSLLKYTYENGRLLDDFEIEDGSLSPVFNSSKNHSLELNARYGFKASGRTAGQLYGRFFSYLNNPSDTFYLDYIGGFTGMRSYPFFALGGNTTAFGQFSYIFPIVTNINRQLGRYTFDKLFLRLFTEVGNTWDSPLHNSGSLKTGLGSEIRFAFNSYYLFPLKLFVSSSYGFNQFDVTLPDEFITETATGNVSYGKELLFHFGLTFDFNILNHE